MSVRVGESDPLCLGALSGQIMDGKRLFLPGWETSLPPLPLHLWLQPVTFHQQLYRNTQLFCLFVFFEKAAIISTHETGARLKTAHPDKNTSPSSCNRAPTPLIMNFQLLPSTPCVQRVGDGEDKTGQMREIG